MAAFPPPAVDGIDWAHIGFELQEVNGHIESTYTKSTGKWGPLRFVKDPFVKVHGLSPALNYGQQAFEGLKAFRTPGDESIVIFRPERNGVRLQHSAEFVSMPPFPVDLFLESCRAAVALNAEFVPPHDSGAALYMRPLMYGSSGQLPLTPGDEFTYCLFVVPSGSYHGSAPTKALILEDFDRTAPNGTGNAKVGGNYAPVLRWSDRAKADGFGITLHLDSARHEEIDEFSTSGFIGITVDGDNITMAVPDSKCVIDSVTSRSVQELGAHFGWKVEKRPVKYTELDSFTEVMAAGTAAALVPIRSITRRTDAGEKVSQYIPAEQAEPGPLFTKLITTLQGIQRGKLDDPFGWRLVVNEADTKLATLE